MILRVARTIKNALVPVNKLPPEILPIVIGHRTCERDLVIATHVCQRWRSTLVSSPSLWTCFRITSDHNHDVNRTLTYLERSKLAPIDIRVKIDTPRSLDAFRHLAPHIAKTRTLDIVGHHTKVREAPLLLCAPSPILQHLEFCVYGGPMRLPDDFLGQHVPLLRSLTLYGIHPGFESLFPLPSLVEFNLFLPNGPGPFLIVIFFRHLSYCPWLRKIRVKFEDTPQDIALDQVLSLESLVELDYTCNRVGQTLPRLRLPRLTQLSVSTYGLGQVQRLTDLLSHDGRALLAGVTEMIHHSDKSSQTVQLYGNGVDVSFIVILHTGDHSHVNRFFSGMGIPLREIEKLTVEGSDATDFPISFPIFKKLKVLTINPRRFTEGPFLRSLYPSLWTRTPCQALQEMVWRTCPGFIGPPVSLVRERKRAGHPLGLVRLLTTHKPDQSFMDSVEELERHVGEVRIGWV